MEKKHLILLLVIVLLWINGLAQESEAQRKDRLDSLYITEIQRPEPVKILHAEPLYIDLIRDLGARKGEKEWNIGFGLTDNNQFDEYTALVEYEFAPIDRLGLEIELPFSFHYPTTNNSEAPKNKLNSLKLAGQYSFFVSEAMKTSMALGYIHEFELTSFSNYGVSNLFTGNVYNPFFVVAKRWKQNFHTLIYTGPQFIKHYHSPLHTLWQFNSNVHYMIDGSRNFIGIEFNKSFGPGDFDLTIRPQMRVAVTSKLLVGIVTGIPIKRENERFSSFLRLIYEPGH